MGSGHSCLLYVTADVMDSVFNILRVARAPRTGPQRKQYGGTFVCLFPLCWRQVGVFVSIVNIYLPL